ncbi:MAG: hypothetical protein UY63_C0002G0015 [Parcubacteria group bacterium GW2011_GWA2_51_10]|nr:MAG: hypothetical protein UY63_C0002G0015 [Parcubacteria group bacterium GW2011_GWA2_51_10]
MTPDRASFYFANLGADIIRCALALESGNIKNYEASRERAWKTLSRLEKENHPEAYEEGLLMLRGLLYAHASQELSRFRRNVDDLIAPFALRLAL